MFNVFVEMFSYPFIVKAIIVGTMVSVCSALLGVNLVLKRYSMIGDGLSHVAFGALAIATALGTAPLIITIPVVVISAFFLLKINNSSKIKGDAAIALVSSGALAAGILVLSLTTGMNTDLFSIMFGSILSLTTADTIFSVILSLIVIIIYFLFSNKIFTVTFDESFSKAIGINTYFYNSILAILTAITIVLGMRMMGSLLISSLIIFPALTAMTVCKHFKHVIVCSAAVSIFSFIIGIVLSYIFETPTGATVVAVSGILFILFKLIKKIA